MSLEWRDLWALYCPELNRDELDQVRSGFSVHAKLGRVMIARRLKYAIGWRSEYVVCCRRTATQTAGSIFHSPSSRTFHGKPG